MNLMVVKQDMESSALINIHFTQKFSLHTPALTRKSWCRGQYQLDGTDFWATWIDGLVLWLRWRLRPCYARSPPVLTV